MSLSSFGQLCSRSVCRGEGGGVPPVALALMRYRPREFWRWCGVTQWVCMHWGWNSLAFRASVVPVCVSLSTPGGRCWAQTLRGKWVQEKVPEYLNSFCRRCLGHHRRLGLWGHGACQWLYGSGHWLWDRMHLENHPLVLAPDYI